MQIMGIEAGPWIFLMPPGQTMDIGPIACQSTTRTVFIVPPAVHIKIDAM